MLHPYIQNSLRMKRLALIFLLSLPIIGFCQQQAHTPHELDVYDGLMYSGADLKELKRTADSLNLRYLQCEPNPVYHSWPQARAEFRALTLKRKEAALIKAGLKQNTPLQQILANFQEIETKDGANVIMARQIEYDEYEKKYDTILYSGDGNGFTRINISGQETYGNWVLGIDENKNDDGDKLCYMTIWRLDTSFTSIQLPQEYAKMIQYVDCMIDTNTVLMLDNGESSEEENKPLKDLKKLVSVNRKKNIDARFNAHFDEGDIKYIRREFYKNHDIRQLLANAIKEAIEKRNGSGLLERLADSIYSKDTILLLKRSRIVYGSCSMDDAPRRHARDIAVLASQTHQWPVFIRAHLDIMNDYFQRSSDGSYAEAGRKTYLRELELLDIPAQQLLLGSIFRASNLPSSHYIGNLNRIGRAFTESEHAATFEKQVKSFMKDDRLDPFNKCLFFMLYTSYCYRQPKESDTNAKIGELKKESSSYPEYIRAAIARLK